jgi:hypothetical protein
MAVTRTAALIVTAATAVAAVLKAYNVGDAGALSDASAVFARVQAIFNREIEGAVTKTASGANAAALWTAASIVDGEVWKAAGTGDTTDTLLATAKGSAPAAGDIFQRVGSTVVFVVAAAGLSVDSLFRE